MKAPLVHYRPNLIGVSDHVARTIADRLLADVRAKDKRVNDRTDFKNILGSMRNPKSQQRSHRRLVASIAPMVVDHHLATGREFQSLIVNITEANGWVLAPEHRGIGVRVDVIGCTGRNQPLEAFCIKVAVIDRHLIPRIIQRAGLVSYEMLLDVIKKWSSMLITHNCEVIDIAEWLCEQRVRILMPLIIHGKACAIVTGSEPGLEVKHPVLRAITLLSNDMLTADDCKAFDRLKERELTRLELIKTLPRRAA